MLEEVVRPGGTGTKAAVDGYRIAGKTGTAWKFATGGYSQDKYISIFAGLAPASDPRLATVVVIDEPTGELYYGSDVAAPVFADVMAESLRLLAVPPMRCRRAIPAASCRRWRSRRTSMSMPLNTVLNADSADLLQGFAEAPRCRSAALPATVASCEAVTCFLPARASASHGLDYLRRRTGGGRAAVPTTHRPAVRPQTMTCR